MYRRALAIKGDHAPSWSNLGVSFAQSGNLAAAEEPFLNACKFEPSNKHNWVNLAKLHQARGNTPAAKEAMMRAQTLH